MKKYLTIISCLAAFVFLFQSCKKEESLQFNYSGEKIILTLKPDSKTPTSFDSLGTVYFNADSLATANKFPREALKDITITDMEFTLLSAPVSENFNLIKTMEGSIWTADQPSPVNIFNTDKISSRTIDKIVVSGINQNVKEKVFNNKYFTFSLKGELNDTLTKTQNIEVRFTYAVSLLGVKI